MIPKVIHYCWFGGAPLPEDAKKCIASWRKCLPDYEIKEWNEASFDIHINDYVRGAYEAKKYAFVSDYARFWILYNSGGLYFDTDVEVIKPMDHIIASGPFMGIERTQVTRGLRPDDGSIAVAPGLGLGAEPAMPLYAKILDYYNAAKFQWPETKTVVGHTTEILKSCGYRPENRIQNLAGVTIYPDDYFCPMDSTTGLVEISPNTVSIHHYSCSWIDKKSLAYRIHVLKNKLIRIFGPKIIVSISNIIKSR